MDLVDHQKHGLMFKLLIDLMVVDGRRMKRASAAPAASAAAAREHRTGGPGRIDRDAGLRVLPAVREREP